MTFPLRAVRGTGRTHSAWALVVTLVLLAPSVGRAAVDLRPRQWGLDKVRAPGAWATPPLATSRGQTVTIAILDTGVDHTHEDLAGKVLRPAGSNLTCTSDDAASCPNDPMDHDGHGTHVAGIAAAIADNGKGIAGTAPGARILAVKVIDDTGTGDLEWLAQGIRLAVDAGARVLNISAGMLSGVDRVPGLTQDADSAIDYAWSRGAVLVAAAGNDALPVCQFPAAHGRVICVGGVDRYDRPTVLTNWGEVDVVAPGGAASPLTVSPDGSVHGWIEVGFEPSASGPHLCESDIDVWSTWSTHASARPADCGIPGYQTAGGTSMAVPFVSGVAALLLARGLNNARVVSCIRSTASELGEPGPDPLYGHGRVDALRAVTSTSCSAP